MVATGLVALSPTKPASAAAPTITKVAAGEFACAAPSLGSVSCWGTGPLGERQLPTWPSGLPAASGLVADITGATDVGVGAQFMCAIVADGAVKCHGWDYDNQLGDPTGGYPGDIRTEAVGA